MGLTCDVCGKSFEARAGARYCSGQCRTVAYRQRHAPADQKRPRRGPLRDQFIAARFDLDRAIRRWERVVSDDRFPRARRDMAHFRNDLLRQRDALDALLDRWPE